MGKAQPEKGETSAESEFECDSDYETHSSNDGDTLVQKDDFQTLGETEEGEGNQSVHFDVAEMLSPKSWLT
jgi:hypothetical protein